MFVLQYDFRNSTSATGKNIKLLYRHLTIYNESVLGEARLFFNERLILNVPMNSSVTLLDAVPSKEYRTDITVKVDNNGSNLDVLIINHGEPYKTVTENFFSMLKGIFK